MARIVLALTFFAAALTLTGAQPNPYKALFDIGVTEVQRFSYYNASDYMLDLLTTDTHVVTTTAGGSLGRFNVATVPALAGVRMAMTLIHLNPCGMNPPHTHPRASEAIYIINATNVQVGVVEENGGKVIVNNLRTGMAVFIPQGALHYEVNLDCNPVLAVAANNHEDPGVLSIPMNFYRLPNGAVRAALGIDSISVTNEIIAALPAGQPPGVAECRRACGLPVYNQGIGSH